MKAIFALVLLTSFAAHANPLLTVKDRLRIVLWSEGIETKPAAKKAPQKILPEEIERPLRKI